jgi:hypothetical protein
MRRKETSLAAGFFSLTVGHADNHGRVVKEDNDHTKH